MGIHTLSELFVEFEQHPALILNLKLLSAYLVAKEEGLGFVLQGSFQIVVFGHFADGLQIAFELLPLLAHLGESVPHLVEQVAEADHCNYLDGCSHDDFLAALGSDVAVADGEHGGAGEVEGVDVFGEGVCRRDARSLDPVVGGVDFGGAEEDDGLGRGLITKRWAWMKTLSSRSRIFIWFSYLRLNSVTLMHL